MKRRAANAEQPLSRPLNNLTSMTCGGVGSHHAGFDVIVIVGGIVQGLLALKQHIVAILLREARPLLQQYKLFPGGS